MSFQPTFLSVLKEEPDKVWIILNFETFEECAQFMENYINDKEINISIRVREDNDTYVLRVEVPEINQSFTYQTGITQEQYDSYKYLHEGHHVFFSTGTRDPGSQLKIYQPFSELGALALIYPPLT